MSLYLVYRVLPTLLQRINIIHELNGQVLDDIPARSRIALKR